MSPAPRSWRQRHNTRRRRQHAAYRVGRRIDAARCLMILPSGHRCSGPAIRHGYCLPCWGGEGAPADS